MATLVRVLLLGAVILMPGGLLLLPLLAMHQMKQSKKPVITETVPQRLTLA